MSLLLVALVDDVSFFSLLEPSFLFPPSSEPVSDYTRYSASLLANPSHFLAESASTARNDRSNYSGAKDSTTQPISHFIFYIIYQTYTTSITFNNI